MKTKPERISMTYLKVKWLNSEPPYPLWLYSELDADRWETRKVDIFADGSMQWADENSDPEEGTVLGEAPAPPVEELNADEEFEAEEISREEFERVWNEATKAAGV